MMRSVLGVAFLVFGLASSAQAQEGGTLPVGDKVTINLAKDDARWSSNGWVKTYVIDCQVGDKFEVTITPPAPDVKVRVGVRVISGDDFNSRVVPTAWRPFCSSPLPMAGSAGGTFKTDASPAKKIAIQIIKWDTPGGLNVLVKKVGAPTAGAVSDPKAQNDVEQLKREVAELRKEINEIKTLLKELKRQP
jgi:hypothetical protein